MLNTLTVEFPNSTVTPGAVATFYISEAMYEHSMFTVTFKNWDVDEYMVKTGSPVKVTISNHQESVTRYAYIDSLRHIREPGNDYVEMIAIGASYVFKQPRQDVYVNSTASDVAKKIARGHRFSYDIKPHPRVYSQIAQAGMTDWQLLTKLAKQSGYMLWAEAATIHFKPISETYDNEKTLAPVFSMGTVNSPFGTSIYDFNVLVGDHVAYPDAQKAAVAVLGHDPQTGKPISYTPQKAPLSNRQNYQPAMFDKFDVTTVVTDSLAAKYEAEGADQRNRFSYRAKATLLGTPSVVPGSAVYFEGLSSTLDGYWMVLSVEHSMEDYKYITTVTVATDSLGSEQRTASGASPVPLRSRIRPLSPTGPNLPATASVVLSSTQKPTKHVYNAQVSKVKNRLTTTSDTVSNLWQSTLGDVRNYGVR